MKKAQWFWGVPVGTRQKGGPGIPGSGHHGHSGRPGQRGGSTSTSGMKPMAFYATSPSGLQSELQVKKDILVQQGERVISRYMSGKMSQANTSLAAKHIQDDLLRAQTGHDQRLAKLRGAYQ